MAGRNYVHSAQFIFQHENESLVPNLDNTMCNPGCDCGTKSITTVLDLVTCPKCRLRLVDVVLGVLHA